MSKTIFILGAGFSADAHIPVQESILCKLNTRLKKRNYFSVVIWWDITPDLKLTSLRANSRRTAQAMEG